MKIIALEEHFIMPSEERNLPPGAHRGNDREKLLGFDVVGALLDLGDARLAAMDAAGIDLQVLSHNQPGCQALEAGAAIALARDVNDLLFHTVKAHPDRFAAFAALPTADPSAAVKELDRAITRLGFKGAMINGHTHGSFLDDKKFWCILECAQALGVPIYLHPSKPHPAVMKAYFEGYEELALAAWDSASIPAHIFYGWCSPAYSMHFPISHSSSVTSVRVCRSCFIASTTRPASQPRAAGSSEPRPSI